MSQCLPHRVISNMNFYLYLWAFDIPLFNICAFDLYLQNYHSIPKGKEASRHASIHLTFWVYSRICSHTVNNILVPEGSHYRKQDLLCSPTSFRHSDRHMEAKMATSHHRSTVNQFPNDTTSQGFPPTPPDKRGGHNEYGPMYSPRRNRIRGYNNITWVYSMQDERQTHHHWQSSKYEAPWPSSLHQSLWM